jgi:class 3 adenylate cyclase
LRRNDPEVDAVLSAAGLADLAGRFAEEDIDISVLRMLGEEDLREMGLTLGQRKKLLGRLTELAASAGRGPQAAAEPEARRLSVLFSDLVGYTELVTQIDPDELRVIVQAYYAAARHAAGLFGGFIASLQGDGIVMLFGFPLTQVGSADRALGAAHALLGQLQADSHRLPDGRQISITARIGIASGRAIVGYPEGASTGEPQMVGPVINRAARLQGIAEPGCVVVDAPTRSLASPGAGFSPLPDAELKGFTQKVQVWRALGSARPAPGPGPQHMARSAHEAERRRLDEALLGARAGQPAMVLLSGDAGIGKSTLAGEFAADTERDGLRVLRLSCMALSAQVPLHPVVELLEGMLGTATDAAPAVRREALRQLFAGAPAEEAAAAASLLGLRTGLSGMMAPEPDRQLLLGALARFVAVSGPCLILIEDIHWADATTRELLQRCADAAAGNDVMMLATSRDGQDPLWTGNPRRLHLHLAPLGTEAAGRVLSHHLSGRELPEPVVQAILSRSDGNPLMIEALARSIEGWKDTSPGQDIEVPSSIYESIAARVEALRAGRKAAAALSVFGEPVDEATLALALGIEVGELGHALADLTGSGVAERFGSGMQQSVRFRHSLYREVCYERLVKSARESLHRAAFAALTRMDSDIATRRPGHVAWHAFAAGEHATAAPLSLAAGEQSIQRSALIEASHFLHQAQASLDRLARTRQTDQLRLRVLIAQSSICRARLGIASDEAGQLAQQVLELARSLGDTRSELIALNGLYTHALVRADYAAAGIWAGRLRAEAMLSQDPTFSMIGTRHGRGGTPHGHSGAGGGGAAEGARQL